MRCRSWNGASGLVTYSFGVVAHVKPSKNAFAHSASGPLDPGHPRKYLELLLA